MVGRLAWNGSVGHGRWWARELFVSGPVLFVTVDWVRRTDSNTVVCFALESDIDMVLRLLFMGLTWGRRRGSRCFLPR